MARDPMPGGGVPPGGTPDPARSPRLLALDAPELSRARRRRRVVLAVLALSLLAIGFSLWATLEAAADGDVLLLIAAIALSLCAVGAAAVLVVERWQLIWYASIRTGIERSEPQTRAWSCVPVSGLRQLVQHQTGFSIGIRSVISVGPAGLSVWMLVPGGRVIRVAHIEQERIVAARWEQMTATVSSGEGVVISYRDGFGGVSDLRFLLYGHLFGRGLRTVTTDFFAALGFPL